MFQGEYDPPHTMSPMAFLISASVAMPVDKIIGSVALPVLPIASNNGSYVKDPEPIFILLTPHSSTRNFKLCKSSGVEQNSIPISSQCLDILRKSSNDKAKDERRS